MHQNFAIFDKLCFSQGRLAMHCRCGGKYDINLVANLLVRSDQIFYLPKVNTE